MASLGEKLRVAREARNLSISEVSEQIHIRSVYLQAIEEENWASIAAPVYVRGFIRTYARFLGCDPEEAVAQFNAIGSSAPAPEEPSRGGSSELSTQRRWVWVAGGVLIFLVLYVGYNYYQLQVATQAVIMAEASAAPVSPAPLASQDHHRVPGLDEGRKIGIKVKERSWLRVVVDDRTLMEGVFDPGIEREFPGRTAVVRVGNAAGVDIWVNGKDVGTLGQEGGVMERTFNLAQ